MLLPRAYRIIRNARIGVMGGGYPYKFKVSKRLTLFGGCSQLLGILWHYLFHKQYVGEYNELVLLPKAWFFLYFTIFTSVCDDFQKNIYWM